MEKPMTKVKLALTLSCVALTFRVIAAQERRSTSR